jgi:protocatechuate 3,4-dioxygenase beta subunit
VTVAPDIAGHLDRCSTTCQLFAQQEEGPYRRGAQQRRDDVTEGRPGSPLHVGLRRCTSSGDAAAGVDVEVWHCDAEGRYSGYPPNDPDTEVYPSPQNPAYLPDETFLRGAQTTDVSGDVVFHTIYPGWYPGRAVHIHLMVRVAETSYISQLYFPENLTAEVFSTDPYRGHGLPDTTHSTDGIFATGGQPAVLDVHAAAEGHVGVLRLVLPDPESP